MRTKYTVRQGIAKIAGSFLSLFTAIVTVSGQGTIRLTFDNPPPMPPGTAAGFASYSESGVTVRPGEGGYTRRWSGDPLFPDNGTAYLQHRSAEGLWFSYMDGGRIFAAVSVDLAHYSASSLEPVTVQFAAYGYSGPPLATTEFTITGVVDSQGRPAFQTFYFPLQFRDMYSLKVTPATPHWSLDNLVIYVPEPSSVTLLLVGGGLLWAARRRRPLGDREAHEKHETID